MECTSWRIICWHRRAHARENQPPIVCFRPSYQNSELQEKGILRHFRLNLLWGMYLRSKTLSVASLPMAGVGSPKSDDQISKTTL
jgi:hypothetical protein